VFDGVQARVAKVLMQRFSPPLPLQPSPLGPGIFGHDSYRQASPEGQREIMLASAQYRYEYEKDQPFFREYFPWISPDELRGRSLLDLGCFTGGRTVHWKERYQLGEAHGIDIAPVFEEAGRLFADQRGQPVHFATGVGERLPYADDKFDFIVAYDVFEHVQSVERVMAECYRTLKPGGRLLTVFPQLYQPLESHLGQVTQLHGLHWIFSAAALRRAYCEVQQEHGPEAYWYARRLDQLGEWETLVSLNGITVRKFNHIIRQRNWRKRRQNRRPILSSGRRAKRLIFRLTRYAFVLPARLPLLQELFLDRICVDLEKAGG
jgi:SAM-dependent methyltransferase